MSEREILYGNEPQGDYKPITDFHPLKTMEPNTEIYGKHIGRFESKNKKGAFYHLFERDNGEVHGYGTCKVLDERVTQYKEKVQELGLNAEEAYMSTKFLGRLPNKENSNTSYKFTQVVIYKPSSTEQAQENKPVTTDDIPF